VLAAARAAGEPYQVVHFDGHAALTLANAGRRHDALLYARAAPRDAEALGPSAADLTGRARRLIAELEQEPAD
jgi:hypothetical protein